MYYCLPEHLTEHIGCQNGWLSIEAARVSDLAHINFIEDGMRLTCSFDHIPRFFNSRTCCWGHPATIIIGMLPVGSCQSFADSCSFMKSSPSHWPESIKSSPMLATQFLVPRLTT